MTLYTHEGAHGLARSIPTICNLDNFACLQAKESWDLSNEEKVALAQKRKERGNALFKAGKWKRAIAKYKSAAEAVGYDVRLQLITL